MEPQLDTEIKPYMVHFSAHVKFQLKSSQLETDNNGKICYVLENWLITIGQT